MNSSIYHISHSARKQFKTNATLTKFNYDVQIIKENQLTKAFIEIGKEFCRETSLHGMKHIVKKKYQNMKKIGIDDTILKYNSIILCLSISFNYNYFAAK